MVATYESVRYRFGRFELQPEERLLLQDGTAVRIGAHAFDLLVALAEHSGRLVTKEALLARVWGKVVVEENTLQVHVAALRKVLGADTIATVSGRGYRLVAEVVRIDAGAQGERSARKDNLPHQLTGFIGREAQIAQIRELLASTRLITLTGAGGCGKTRLALQVAQGMLDDYADGVWLVELAPLNDATLLPQALADALGIKDEGGRPLTDTLTQWLSARHVLLLLDNAEHLLEASARLSDLLLRRCDRLAIMVTSRERLGIAGEVTYRVPTLSVPDVVQDATSPEALACEAARLFIDRARFQRPGFSVAGRDAEALVSICRHLDGIALAIELAAARVRHMSVEELGRHLNNRFGVLVGGSRTGLAHHRTLRSLIDWSHDLLDDAEKIVLRRASVFAGGWTLEAAEQVCSGPGIDRGEVLDVLTSLADKNLIIAETTGDETRFGMLETVRHYAQDRLRDRGEENLTRGRHVDYLLAMARLVDEPKSDEALRDALSSMDKEHDNLRTALAWCESTATASAAMKGLLLAGRLYWFWITRAAYGEARGWIARLVAATRDIEQGEVHAKALHAAGTLAFSQADNDAAETHHRQALGLWRALGDRRQMLRSIGSLGNVAFARFDYPNALALYGEALAIARETGDDRRVATALLALSNVFIHTGDLPKAQALLEESLAISRPFGSRAVGEALDRLGLLRRLQGNFADARTLLTEALEAYRSSGYITGIARALSGLASTCCDEGDLAAAAHQFREPLAIAQASGDLVLMEEILWEVGLLLLALARPLATARVWGALERFGSLTALPPQSHLRLRVDRQLAAARSAANDDAAFDLAWNEAASWSMADLARYAIDQLQ